MMVIRQINAIETEIAALQEEIRKRLNRMRDEISAERRLQLREQIDWLEQSLLALESRTRQSRRC